MRCPDPDRVSAKTILSGAALVATVFLDGCNSRGSLPDQINAVSSSAVSDSSFSHVSHHVHRGVHADATIAVNPSQVGPPMNVTDLGSGMGVWYDFTLPGIAQAFESADLTLTRFPGGAQSDIYHWQTGTDGPAHTPCAGQAKADSTFDALMQDIAIPANLRVAVTVNYGSNAKCTAGADPSEGAALLSYAQTKGYNVVYATVGNEQYVPGAIDCRQPGCKSSRDGYQYSANEPAFYDALKQADPNVSVCIDANLQNAKSKWNPIVFASAKYDCAEIHYYPQRVITSDQFLLYDALPQFTSELNAVKSELAAAGNPNTPLYLAEISSALGPYGRQSQSIVGALYAGMAVGEIEQDGVAAMTWHVAFGSCDARNRGGDFHSGVYGKQNYGGAMVFSDGSKQNCPARSAPNTLLATANAFLVASYFVHANENMLGVSVAGSSDVRAYAGTYQGGYAVMLFNLKKTLAKNVKIEVAGKNAGSGGMVVTYDKAIYDKSENNMWNPPTVAALKPWTKSIKVNLPAWSVVVVQTQ